MATVATTPTPQSSQGTSPQPAPPPSHGETLLRRAQTANVVPQQVTINGKRYYVVVEVGGNIQNTSLNQADAEKLQHLAKDFFDSHQEQFQRAHQQQSGQAAPSLNHRDIDYVDEKGIHFKDSTRSIQGNTEAKLPPERGAFLLQGLEQTHEELSNYHAHLERLTPGTQIPTDRIPPSLKSFLPSNGTRPFYTPAEVMAAVKELAKDDIKKLGLDIFKWNNKESDIDRFNNMIDHIFSHSSRTLQENLNLANDHLKNHMTAQTVWKVMMRILFPPTMTLIPVNTNAPTNNTRDRAEDPSSDDGYCSSSGVGSDSGQETKKNLGSDSDSDWELPECIRDESKKGHATLRKKTKTPSDSDNEYDSIKSDPTVLKPKARRLPKRKSKETPKKAPEQNNFSDNGDTLLYIATSDTEDQKGWGDPSGFIASQNPSTNAYSVPQDSLEMQDLNPPLY